MIARNWLKEIVGARKQRRAGATLWEENQRICVKQYAQA
jgi:hypothetical protein